MEIQVAAILKFKENSIFEAIEALKVLLIETRKESGCLRYDLIEDNSAKGTFFFIEAWENAEALESHTRTEHYQKFQEKVSGLLDQRTEVYKGSQLF